MSKHASLLIVLVLVGLFVTWTSFAQQNGAAEQSSPPRNNPAAMFAPTPVDAAIDGMAARISDIDRALLAHAENLQNVHTVGYKATRPRFHAETGTVSFERNFSQGSLDSAPYDFHWAIDGEGFFQIEVGERSPSGYAYVRAGVFFVSGNNEIVWNHSDGERLEAVITVPDDATDLSVGTDGRVFATVPDSVDPQELGQIALVRFVNPRGLKVVNRGAVFMETDASGPPIQGYPGEDGFGVIKDGFYEGSNVEPMREYVHIVKLTQWRATLQRSMNGLMHGQDGFKISVDRGIEAIVAETFLPPSIVNP